MWGVQNKSLFYKKHWKRFSVLLVVQQNVCLDASHVAVMATVRPMLRKQD